MLNVILCTSHFIWYTTHPYTIHIYSTLHTYTLHYTTHVLTGQNQNIAHSTKQYLVILIPGLWALSASQCITTWMYAQAKTKAVASITLTVALLHPLWLYLFIFQLQIGFLGSAVALTLTKILELIILLVYINVFSSIVKDSQFAWSVECWRQWVSSYCIVYGCVVCIVLYLHKGHGVVSFRSGCTTHRCYCCFL